MLKLGCKEIENEYGFLIVEFISIFNGLLHVVNILGYARKRDRTYKSFNKLQKPWNIDK